MSVTIDGTTGISGVAGTASAPALIGTDADSGYYINSANEPSASVNGTAVWNAASTFGFKNRLINGRMEINQRGLTGPTSGYFVDRWQVSGVSTTSLQTSGLPTGYTQAVSINRAVVGTATLYQNIESKNVFDLNGQQVTVSFFAKNVSGVGSITVNLSYANSSDNFGAVTSIQTVTASASPSASYAYYTATFSALPSGVANGLQVNINAVIASSGTLEITGAQLEKGSTATSFDYRAYGTELQLCQRYYWNMSSAGAPYMPFGGVGNAVSGNAAYIPFSSPTPMRTAPSVSASTGSALILSNDGIGLVAVATTGVTIVYVGHPTNYQLAFSTAAAALTANRPYSLFAYNNTTMSVTFSAEL